MTCVRKPRASISASSSGDWSPDYDAAKAFDDDDATRWGAPPGSRSGWLQVDLGAETLVGAAEVREIGFPRTREFVIEARSAGGDDAWRELARGKELGALKRFTFPPVRARYVRLNVLDATEVPTIEEFRLFPPEGRAR